MTNYYVEKDNKIVVYDTNKEMVKNAVLYSEAWNGLEVQETERPIVNYQFADTEEYKQGQLEKEQERINNLTMTALDLVSAIKTLGVDSDTIVNFIESNSEIKLQLLCCQNVYCGVVKQFCPINIGDVTLTAEMVEQIFKNKYSYGVADE